MGIFDSYQFDPSAYRGGGQGLLAQLLQVAPPIPQSNGFGTPDNPLSYGQARNVDVGGYQMPQFGSAPQPDPAEIPKNAQLARLQMPQSESGFGDRAVSALRGFSDGGREGGLFGAIAGGISGASGGVNRTAQALIDRGIDPSLAQTVVRDRSLLRAVLPQVLGTAGQTDNIKEYNFAKQEDPSLTFEKFMAWKKSVSGEFGLTPIWGTGPDGKPAFIQPGKSGDARLAKLPEGFSIARDPIKVDAGTHYVLLDPQTRAPVGQVPKDLKGAEIQKAEGEAQGKARAELPGGLIDAEQTTKKINELLAAPGLDSIVGSFDQFRPSWSLGAEGKDALARYNQLKGTAFLSAFGMLRGGGAITEIEGVKAENAMARMDRAQSEGDFRKALSDFRDAVETGVRKLRARAGDTGSTPSVSTPPQTTSLKSKYGLD